MDFTAYDSRAAATVGSWMHVCHPASGLPMMDGLLPCRVLVRGAEAREVQEIASSRARATAAKNSDVKTFEDLHRGLVDSAMPLIIGFENIHRGDVPATSADAEWFLWLNMMNGRGKKDDATGTCTEMSFAEQVLSHSTARANYLGNA